MSPELETDIKKFLTDRSIKQIDLMNKYNTTNNSQIEVELATLKGNNIISDKSEIDNELAKLKEEK